MADKQTKMKTVEFEFPDPDAEQESLEIEVDPAENTTYDVLDTPQKEEKPKAEKQKAEKEVDVEVIDDTPKKDRGRKQSEPPSELTDEELGEYSSKVQQRLKHFSKGYHDQRRAAEAAAREREEALRYAQSILAENQKLKATSSRSRNSLIAQAKKTAEAEAAAAERDYKLAYDSGDSDKVVAAQKRLTEAQVKLNRAKSLRPAPVQKQKPLQGNQTPVQVPQQVPQAPPRPQVDGKALEWQQKNEWFGPDKEMTAFALGVHNRLEAEGIDTRSDEYYEKLDRRIREVFPNEFSDTSSKDSNDSVVAPVTRSTAPRKITLSKSQVAIAKRLNVPLEDYAKQAAMLENREK
jgi:hypothetical protein